MDEQPLDKRDVDTFLWIVGSRTGATFDEVVVRYDSHHKPLSPSQIHESLWRLEAHDLISCSDQRYHAKPELQAEFLDACRNCRDTFEETEILHRIMGI